MKKFAGCQIEFNSSFRLKLKDQIGSGSFSYVYSTDDPRYVVKVINPADQKSFVSFQNEKYAYQNIPRHDNIVYCPAIKDNVNFKGDNYSCIVLENCSRGSIISMLVDKKMTFNQNQIYQITLDVILGLHQLHTLQKPIAHRDLKGENVLLGEDGKFKLIDFGSISTRAIKNINNDNRIDIESDIEKNTTPTIRAPEQCDLYSGLPITEKVDIWALGCLLYILCFQKQPFETKLSIINGQYFLPRENKYDKALLDLFPLMFKFDPKERPNTVELLGYFEMHLNSLPSQLFNSIRHMNVHANRQTTEENVIPGIIDINNNGSTSKPSNMIPHGPKHNKSFMSNLRDYFTKLTTKTEAWILCALEETEDGPHQKFVRYLIIKAWHKPQKIKKFYLLLHKKYTKNPESTIVTLKTLIVLHNYFKKGPNQVYIKGSSKEAPNPRDMLYSINQMWKTILENGLVSNKDEKRDIYTTQLIVEYSELLIKKFDLISKYHKILEGNYSLYPFFTHPSNNVTPISAPVLEDLMKFLESVINFHKMLLLDNQLWKIQCSVATSILDEEYCLISALTHMFASFKHATNYVSIDVNAGIVIKIVENFEGKFEKAYFNVREFFEKCTEINEIQQLSKFIQMLPPDLIDEIRNIPILQKLQSKKFNLLKFLNNKNSICGIKLPLSYGIAVQDINLKHMMGTIILRNVIIIYRN
jgi:serine/threonine protein kinase